MTKFSTAILALLFVGVMFGGLFHMSMGMNMTGAVSGCPFTEQGEVVCSMNATDHIESWKAAFLAVIPTLTLLLTALVAAVIFFTTPLPAFRWQKHISFTQIKPLYEQVYTFTYRPLQELFARGILHPKLF